MLYHFNAVKFHILSAGRWRSKRPEFSINLPLPIFSSKTLIARAPRIRPKLLALLARTTIARRQKSGSLHSHEWCESKLHSEHLYFLARNQPRRHTIREGSVSKPPVRSAILSFFSENLNRHTQEEKEKRTREPQ